MTEKISVTLNLTELGQIDYLVEKGLYNNRSDFMRLAAREAFGKHSKDFEQFFAEGRVVKEKKKSSHIGWFTIGISHLSKSDILQAAEDDKKYRIRCIGAIVIDKLITADEIRQRVESVHVTGKIFASDEVMGALNEIAGGSAQSSRRN